MIAKNENELLNIERIKRDSILSISTLIKIENITVKITNDITLIKNVILYFFNVNNKKSVKYFARIFKLLVIFIDMQFMYKIV